GVGRPPPETLTHAQWVNCGMRVTEARSLSGATTPPKPYANPLRLFFYLMDRPPTNRPVPGDPQ
ncbi:MAG: hypothetical protein WBO92_03275, partial [Candidatus Moraniibacteriota bacterium]